MTAIAERIPAGTWRIDPTHSTVGFAVKHMVVATFRGKFREFDATLSAVDGTPRFEGVARVESIDVRDENLAAHLRSEEFFDAEHHPELRFVSTSVEVDDAGGLTVRGDLTIKGATRPVEARGRLTPAHADAYGGTRVGVELAAVVDRRDYGLLWNQPLPKGGFALADDVTIAVDLELVQEG